MAMFTNQMRFTGMSGLEVNDMVMQLMRGHSVRLDRMRQQRELILWQQQALRGAAADFRTFRDSNLSFTTNQNRNIRSPGNFSSIVSSLTYRSGDRIGEVARGITVEATDPHNTRPRTLRVESAARGDIFRSVFSHNSSIQGTGTFQINQFSDTGVSFNINLNGRTETVSVASHEIGPAMNNESFVELLNSRIRETFGSDAGGQVNPGTNHRDHVWVDWNASNGRLSVNTRAGNTVTIANGTGPDGTTLEQLGFSVSRAPDGSRVNPSTALDPATMSMFDFLGNNHSNFSFEINGTQFAFNGRQLSVDGRTVRDVMDPRGLTVQDVITAVNNSDAGVRMSYSSSSGLFTMESTRAGVTNGAIRFADIGGGFFNRVGFGSSNTLAPSTMTSDAPSFLDGFRPPSLTTDDFDVASLAGRPLRFSVSHGVGEDRTAHLVSFTREEMDAFAAIADPDDRNAAFIAAVNAQLSHADAFGAGTVVQASINPENGRLVFNPATGTGAVTLNNAAFNMAQTTLGQLVADPSVLNTNAAYATDPITFSINGVDFSFHSPDTTINQILTAVNSSGAGVRMTFSAATGRFSIANTDAGQSARDIQLESTGTVDFFDMIGFDTDPDADSVYNTYRQTSRNQIATDAVVYIDGQRFVRDSNSFEIDGLRITLNPSLVTESSSTSPAEINLIFERDSSNAMQLIRDFIDEYNALIRSIRDLTEARRPRATGGGFYMPLTEEQRRGMSEREVEMWEEQARTGILSRDSTLRQLTGDLHRAIFQDVQLSNGDTLNLLHLGIRTHRDLDRFGELQIDEERLQYFIDNHIDQVTELFTNFSEIPAVGEGADRTARLAEAGIGQRISDIIHWQLTHGGGLYDRAGATVGGNQDSGNENNALSRRLTQEDRRIDSLLRNLQRREDRYFQMFGRLEAAMIQANSQMMFMEQMFWMA